MNLHYTNYASLLFRGKLICNIKKVVVVAFGAADDDGTVPCTLMGPNLLQPSCVVGFSGYSHFSRFFLRNYLLNSLKKKFWHCVLLNPMILPMLNCSGVRRASPCLLHKSLSPSLSQQLSFLYLI
jgi:hypothetical protein